MNLASILPCATVRSGARGTAPTATPTGFLDVLAAQSAAAGEAALSDALPLGGDVLGDGGEDGAVEELLALAALASRTAHAALPQVLPTEGAPVEGRGDAADAATVPAVDGATAGDVAPEAAAAPDVAVSDDQPSPAEATVAAPDGPDGADVAPVAAEHAATGAGDQLPSSGLTSTTQGAASTPDEDAGTPLSPVEAAGRTGAPEAAGEGDELPARRVDAAPAAPSERQRGRVEAAPSRAGSDGVRAVDGDVGTAPTQPGNAAPATGRADALVPSSAAQRVLDLVSQLEDAPPPRVVVIETGEIRLRIGLDAGTVRLTVLGQLGPAGEEILRETTDALEADGFGTELDRGTGEDRGRRQHADDRDVPHPAGAVPTRPATRSRSGIQL